ncbi:3-oxo-5-alpha-steroid 4-dehydrogenase 1-like protein, partial [Corchorus capsularis]
FRDCETLLYCLLAEPILPTQIGTPVETPLVFLYIGFKKTLYILLDCACLRPPKFDRRINLLDLILRVFDRIFHRSLLCGQLLAFLLEIFNDFLESKYVTNMAHCWLDHVVHEHCRQHIRTKCLKETRSHSSR